MPRHEFTPEERAKGHEARRRSKVRKAYDAIRQQYSEVPEAEWPMLIWQAMHLHAIGVRTADAISLGYARTLLPYLFPRLRATDPETFGEDPINLNEEAEKAIKEKFGDLHNGSIERD